MRLNIKDLKLLILNFNVLFIILHFVVVSVACAGWQNQTELLEHTVDHAEAHVKQLVIGSVNTAEFHDALRSSFKKCEFFCETRDCISEKSVEKKKNTSFFEYIEQSKIDSPIYSESGYYPALLIIKKILIDELSERNNILEQKRICVFWDKLLDRFAVSCKRIV